MGLVVAGAPLALAVGLCTADIMQDSMARVSTSVMGEAIVRELDKAAAWLWFVEIACAGRLIPLCKQQTSF